MLVGSSLLLELGVPFGRSADGLRVESQALNGLRLWSRHFDRVTVCAVEQTVGVSDGSTIVWADPSALLAEGKVFFEPLPMAYRPKDYFRVRGSVKDRFRSLVESHRYLCFSTFGVFGCWGNIAVAESRRQRRDYSLWFDWVLHEMAPVTRSFSARNLKNRLFTALTKRVTYRAIRHCSLGLFHGKTVYDAYAPLCRRPALVHDVHVHPEDAIDDSALARKLSSLVRRPVLKIGYVGRAHPMKAPLQWIDAIVRAAEQVGADKIDAEWLGDGPLLEAARQQVEALGLVESIRFPGFVSDRAAVLSFLRERDVLVFCHLSPESPRCLIEALISGTPLIGYESAYASELVGERGGALLSPIGDTAALAARLVALVEDRDRLRALVEEAAANRAVYNDESVFAHRSELIKACL